MPSQAAEHSAENIKTARDEHRTACEADVAEHVMARLVLVTSSQMQPSAEVGPQADMKQPKEAYKPNNGVYAQPRIRSLGNIAIDPPIPPSKKVDYRGVVH